MLIRTMLLREDEESITLAPCIPHEWLRLAGEIKVDGAATRFGPISYTLNWGDDEIEPHMHADISKLRRKVPVLWHGMSTQE